MTLLHSTQCTLPALCSSSETQSEIRRLYLQVKVGLMGNVWGLFLVFRGSWCTSRAQVGTTSWCALS